MVELHQKINERLLSGCTPLFILCENFIGKECNPQDELQLPIKIDSKIPVFTISSSAEERFAFVDKVQGLISLWSRKIINLKRRRPLGEEYALQLKKTTLKELSRWLGNYREQLKYTFLRPHLEECHSLVSAFFIDLLASTEVALERSEQLAGDNRQTNAEKIKKLKEIETLLEELAN